ncbi:MAG: hypothetical protein ACJ75T_01800 [Solirubrobacterales bacterium]
MPDFSKAHICRLAHITAILLILGLAAASTAATAATYETVTTFGGTSTPPAAGEEWPEQVQLGGASGMAINRTGAGGVPKGTVFVAVPPNSVGAIAGNPLLEAGVARYAPDGTFEETFTRVDRCGPIVPGSPPCGSRPSGNKGIDVDIDQSTGNVYLLNSSRGKDLPLIAVFSPDGSEIIGEFGLRAAFTETASQSPDRIHSAEGLAVSDDGEVYVFDEDNPSDFYRRLMIFKPQSPGDYAHYVYAGKDSDIGGTFGQPSPRYPVLDDSGNVYAGGDGFIVKYDLSVSRDKPVCTYTVGSGITAFTVNPDTGEVFYYSGANRKLHLLNPCNAQGKFVETDPPFKAVPERDSISTLAFDPTRVFGEGNPPGVLYGVAPNGDNQGGIGGDPKQSALGYIFSRPPNLTPVVESESVSSVRTTSAGLHALINPKGSLTSFKFQYIDQVAWEANNPSERFAGASEAPVGGAELGSGQVPLLASASISGLAPGRTYHYRVVATSAQGTAAGADQIFRTFAPESPGLPDHRAYELVSPVQKNGGEPLPLQPNRGSCAGCKPGLTTTSGFPVQVSPDGESLAYRSQPFRLNVGPTEYDENVARRTAAGWQSTGLGPPTARPGQGFASFGLDPALERSIIYVNNPSLAPEAPLDYHNLLTQTINDPLALESLLKETPPNRDTEGANEFLLLYAGASADLSRVFFAANDALTGATAVAPAAVDGGPSSFNLYEWSDGDLRLVNVAPGNSSAAPGATFGARAAGPNEAEVLDHAISVDGSRVFWRDAAGQLYVRENAETTREIPVPGDFRSASPDGSRLLLSSGNVFDLGSETAVDLTGGKGGFVGMVGKTDDLSRIYFVSTSVLDENSNAQGQEAEAGKNNLYAWQEGSVRFIATLLPGDNNTGAGESGDWHPAPAQRSAQTSPDGHVLAFISEAKLTEADNFGICPHGFDPEGTCEEVYVYHSDSDALTCASCNPVGALPLGNSALPATKTSGGYLQQTRFVSDSGRVYFDSRDSLSPQDTNDGVEDVYQYEPDGTGSCAKEGGCVSLISAGREPVDSNFLAADTTGKNVFFTTRDQLVLRDKDDLLDVYVAREGGGFPAETEVARSECQGEACQPPYSPPNDPTPASLGFDGAGNLDEKPPARKHKKHHKKKHKSKHSKDNNNGKRNRGGAK